MNYEAFLTCQVQQTRGAGNDKGEASNTAVSPGTQMRTLRAWHDRMLLCAIWHARSHMRLCRLTAQVG